MSATRKLFLGTRRDDNGPRFSESSCRRSCSRTSFFICCCSNLSSIWLDLVLTAMAESTGMSIMRVCWCERNGQSESPENSHKGQDAPEAYCPFWSGA